MTNILDELDAAGYIEAAPTPQICNNDKFNCDGFECPECQHHGMIYEPRTKGNSYRAFAVCPECEHIEEF